MTLTHLVTLTEDCITEPLYYPAGMEYLDAIQDVLASAGAQDVIIEDTTDTALATAREFELGTSKRAIINTLLNEINFNPLYCDATGRYVISKYFEPTEARAEYAYKADRLSIIGSDISQEKDYYNTPNVFIAVCSNPELDQDYVSMWINDSPASPLSTVQRGRRIVSSPPYQPESISSQEDLDEYIKRVAFESNQIQETLRFTTALNPLHERGDVLFISHPNVEGVFVESSWMLPLSYDGVMEHEARRLVII